MRDRFRPHYAVGVSDPRLAFDAPHVFLKEANGRKRAVAADAVDFAEWEGSGVFEESLRVGHRHSGSAQWPKLRPFAVFLSAQFVLPVLHARQLLSMFDVFIQSRELDVRVVSS